MKLFKKYFLAWVIVLLFPVIITAQQWWNVGSAGFSAGSAGYTSIAIDGSGTPYVVYQDGGNSNKATVMKYDVDSWVTVGTPGFSPYSLSTPTIAIDGSGTPYVAFQDYGASYTFKATVMKFNGASWETVGTAGFSAGTAGNTSIAINGSGTPYVVYRDNGNSDYATVMKFDGSSWVTVGAAGFSAGTASGTSIAIDGSGTPYVVYSDNGNSDYATVMKFNGSSWVTVGAPGFSAGSVDYTSIAINGSGTPYVVYKDNGNSAFATVMKFDGSNWVPVGATGFSNTNVNYTSIAIDGSGTPYVVYQNTGLPFTFKANVWKYDGSNWVTIGSAGISAGQATYTSIKIAPNGTPVVCFKDQNSSGKATVMKYSVNQSDPLPVELIAFRAIVNGSNIILKWQTATEVNNYGFEVEKSQETEFSSQNSDWTDVGFVAGAGNSNSPKSYFYTDQTTGGTSFSYRLKQIDNNGNYKYYDAITVTLTANQSAELMDNYPNPFNPSTSIKFYIPNNSDVSIKIYDMLGKEVATLVNEYRDAGTYKIEFNAEKLSSGVYYYQLRAGSFVETKKMILLK